MHEPPAPHPYEVKLAASWTAGGVIPLVISLRECFLVWLCLFAPLVLLNAVREPLFP